MGEFSSIHDMVEASIASGHIPIYDRHGRLGASWRGELFVDGGDSDNEPRPFGDEIPALVLGPKTWRSHSELGKSPVPFVRADWEWCDEKYEQGKRDAAEHHDELAAFFATPGGVSAWAGGICCQPRVLLAAGLCAPASALPPATFLPPVPPPPSTTSYTPMPTPIPLTPPAVVTTAAAVATAPSQLLPFGPDARHGAQARACSGSRQRASSRKRKPRCGAASQAT